MYLPTIYPIYQKSSHEILTSLRPRSMLAPNSGLRANLTSDLLYGVAGGGREKLAARVLPGHVDAATCLAARQQSRARCDYRLHSRSICRRSKMCLSCKLPRGRMAQQ